LQATVSKCITTWCVLGKQNVQAKQAYSLSLVKQELKLRSLRQRELHILTENQRKVALCTSRELNRPENNFKGTTAR